MIRSTFTFLFVLFLGAGLPACAAPEQPAPTATPPVLTLPATESAAAPTDVLATVESPAQPSPTAEPAPTDDQVAGPASSPEPTSLTLCPEVPRPALLLFNGTNYELANPLSGESCAVSLTAEDIGPEFIAGDSIYFLQRDLQESAVIVSRRQPGGREQLPATRVEGELYFHMQFAVAPDGSRLAWSQVQPTGEPAAMLSILQVGSSDGSDAVTIFEEIVGGEGILGPATPIRFSGDSATLFFTRQPFGIGGMWSGFNGRYDNLYRVAATGGVPEKVFDCADLDLFLCLGDFRDDGTLAYIDADRVIHVVGPDGAELAAIPTEDDYAGYPTFNPAGDLFFSTAVLPSADDVLEFPMPGTVYRVREPYTDEPKIIASARGLLIFYSLNPFLDNDQLVVKYAEGNRWGSALLSTSGAITLLEPWPHAYLATVWPED